MFENIGVIIAIAAVVLAGISLLLFIARNYIKVPPNTALVVVGRGQPRFVTSGAVFRIPLLHRVFHISLETFQVPVRIENTPNVDGVQVTLEAVANLKIAGEAELLRLAAQRFLGMPGKEIKAIANETLEGMLRQLAGTLTIEEMVREREKISQAFLTDSVPELEKLGVRCDNFIITRVVDEQGYIEALGKKKTAEVKRDATIGEAEAERDATQQASRARKDGEEERLRNEELIAEANKALALKVAAIKVETEQAEADADMSRALREAEIKKDLVRREVDIERSRVEAQIQVAEQEANRKEKELVATEIKPAEATRQSAVIRAEGEAEAEVRKADGERQATIARAEAQKERIAKEGEGHAAAQAAQKRQIGQAEADARRAQLLAEAEGARAKGEAEGAAISAKLGAEAQGYLEKVQALSELSEAAKLIFVLEHLPGIIEEAGEAGERVVSTAFEAVGNGLSRIDNLTMVDMGSGTNSSNPVTRFAQSIPSIVFQTFQQAKALGIDLNFLKKFGIDVEKIVGGEGTQTLPTGAERLKQKAVTGEPEAGAEEEDAA